MARDWIPGFVMTNTPLKKLVNCGKCPETLSKTVEICGKNLVKNKSDFFKSIGNERRLPVNGLKEPENRQKFTGFKIYMGCALCCFYFTLNFPYTIKTA